MDESTISLDQLGKFGYLRCDVVSTDASRIEFVEVVVQAGELINRSSLRRSILSDLFARSAIDSNRRADIQIVLHDRENPARELSVPSLVLTVLRLPKPRRLK